MNEYTLLLKDEYTVLLKHSLMAFSTLLMIQPDRDVDVDVFYCRLYFGKAFEKATHTQLIQIHKPCAIRSQDFGITAYLHSK